MKPNHYTGIAPSALSLRKRFLGPPTDIVPGDDERIVQSRRAEQVPMTGLAARRRCHPTQMSPAAGGSPRASKVAPPAAGILGPEEGSDVVAAQIVTLLFTDLTGSSALLRRLGDEAGEDLRRRHFGILRKAVAETGGQEVKNLGDGLMVVFDSAVAASRCAISMQRAIERHNAAGGSQLGVRVGIHVGEPIRHEDDYFGAAVVVAKRLCDAARRRSDPHLESRSGPGVAQTGFVFVPVGDIPAQRHGRAGERLLGGVARAPYPGRASGAGFGGPAGARSGDWKPSWIRPTPGRLRVVLMLGEAGVGKTRLASELVDRHRDGVISLSARAYPLGATASLGLWVEALERRLRSFPESEVLELCGGQVDDLAALLPSVSAAANAHPPPTGRGSGSSVRSPASSRG